MKKKGFATSAILYTLLLLFLVLMVGILNNLQSKKTILDQLKMETIQAIESSNGTCYELQEQYNDLKENFDVLNLEIKNGKQLLANTLTSRGVSTSDTDSFETIANHIEQIPGTLNGTFVSGKIEQDLISVSNYEVELGFKPVYVQVTITHNDNPVEFTTLNVYDERIDTVIRKKGHVAVSSMGLPDSAEQAIYDNGFRVSQTYGYGGWNFYYIALKEFPES